MQRTLTLSFLRPSQDDFVVNRLTGALSKHGICHVELVFDCNQAFSIYHNSTPFLRHRSFSNPRYEHITLGVSQKEYTHALQFCKNAVEQQYAFDDKGLYLASIHPGGCFEKSSAVEIGRAHV